MPPECIHPKCDRYSSKGEFCDRCAQWVDIPLGDRPEWCPCARKEPAMSNLIVSDANGKRYRPTGCFREPKPGEFIYCFDHKRVERRHPSHADSALTSLDGVDLWVAIAHPEFNLHRIICEPVPVEYEVRVRLTQEQFDRLDSTGWVGEHMAALQKAKANGNYEEVNS